MVKFWRGSSSQASTPVTGWNEPDEEQGEHQFREAQGMMGQPSAIPPEARDMIRWAEEFKAKKRKRAG